MHQYGDPKHHVGIVTGVRATELGWRVWYFMPEQVVKCKVGRKTMPDEIIPVLTKLPWV